jgi:hypothetical protein
MLPIFLAVESKVLPTTDEVDVSFSFLIFSDILLPGLTISVADILKTSETNWTIERYKYSSFHRSHSLRMNHLRCTSEVQKCKFTQGHPVATCVFFRVLPSLVFLPLSILQSRVLEDIYVSRCDECTQPFYCV